MIWVDGRVVHDDELRVSVLDRTFEHGLGLFETLRTWKGRAPLLEPHLARMEEASTQLKLGFEHVTTPDETAVRELVEAEGLGPEVVLRIVLSGGRQDRRRSTLWMRALPLPPPLRREGAVVDVGSWTVIENDPFTRFKSLNYWARRTAHENARNLGFDEVLSATPDGRLWEGSRTNLFMVHGSTLVTPTHAGPIVPGIMRAAVLDAAASLPLRIEVTSQLTREALVSADEVFLTNSVRGLIPVLRIEGRTWPAPGRWTRMLLLTVAGRLGLDLEAGETP